MNRVVEILAPAGSMECLQAAIAAGADAVYLGGTRFGARAYAQNLSEEDMVQAIEYVHIHRNQIKGPASAHKEAGLLAFVLPGM